ncbi:conserved membrane hypothetical protein [uncultured Sporomusa sp.]|uniref:ECF transporter S component n=1 Tax=uncultured Sporomusa sp. TaxID=307249 RepID=A0A212M0N9_9FIRM|nr:ECF transporter S component [uncultured Sporomusa sp.]SCM83219.1 conserved membrane hypothetical protein [uncultured Sporomusa sp.]
MTQTQKMIGSSMFIALGVLIPMVFHVLLPAVFHFYGLGAVLLPMHIPVLMAGLLLGSKAGLTVGIITPLISNLLTSMPPLVPMLPIMMLELPVYGICCGYFYRKMNFSLLWSLAIALIVGRLASVVAVFLLTAAVNINIEPLPFITGIIITGIPGLVIQLLFVPLMVRKLEHVLKY